MTASPLRCIPVTPARWRDLKALFGERGACGGCWCMAWRLAPKVYQAGKGRRNQLALRRLVALGGRPGVLAYVDGKPVGWCAVAPRSEYSFLERSRVLRPVDDQEVWSVSCFFVLKPFRRQGVSVELLRAAVALAGRRGARVVEGYPVVPPKAVLPDVFLWTGAAAAFERAGFRTVARRSRSRPVMRYFLSRGG
jgi:GNAT superfamily N-acetyltransferase